MHKYEVSYHLARQDYGLPGDVGQVLWVGWARSAAEALRASGYRVTGDVEGEYLWARRAGAEA